MQSSLARAVVKAPQNRRHNVLKSLQWLKTNERVKHKFLSLKYKVVRITQPTVLSCIM